MDPILDRARSGQDVLERLANKIPGFKGYRERELRRDADQLTREHLAGLLEACKKPLNELSVTISRSGDLSGINDLETARKRLDKVAARIRYADRGYSGFFDALKVEEATLARVYEFDLGLLAGVEAVGGALAGPLTGVAGLIESLGALDAQLTEREAILSGFK
jgi:hypothetical protein